MQAEFQQIGGESTESPADRQRAPRRCKDPPAGDMGMYRVVVTSGRDRLCFPTEIEPMPRRPRAVIIACVLSAAVSAPALAAQGDRRPRSFAPAPAAPGDARIARLDRVQALVDLTYPGQRFDLGLELSTGGALAEGQRFEVAARADRAAVLLLLNVDRTGVVSVIHPVDPGEMTPTSHLLKAVEVVPPYGDEVLKLFAFRRAPAGLERWLGRQVDALDADFDDLLRLLRAPGTEAATARLEVVTSGRAGPEAEP